MARLVWSAQGERYFESGVDQGVLFVGNNAGVPWNGLVSVAEAPNGGDPKPFYVDGYKYLNIAAAEEFEATINAFSAPREFNPCDGIGQVQNGLYATQQRRMPFGLSYRTRIGNDTEGTDHGYKIHMVYNALAAPSDRDNSTMGDTPTPVTFSWQISTLAPKLTGYRPTAHLVIDSLMTPAGLLTQVEDIIYGNDTGISRMPGAQELLDMFTNYVPA